MSVDIACDGAVRSRQFDRHGVRTEHASPPWGVANFLGVVWELDCIYGIAPYLYKERLIHRGLKPERDASRVRQRVFLRIDRRALRLFLVGTSKPIAGRSRIPEVSAKKRCLGCVEVEYRETGCISVSLRGPLAGPELKRSRIRHHRQIDRRDRSAEACIRHVAETTRPIFEGRYILVEIHDLAH